MKGEWCYWESHFPKTFCEKIIEELKDSDFEEPTVGLDRKGKAKDYRAGKITWLDFEKYEYLYDHVWKLTRKSNEDWFNFHLTGMEKIQFSKYEPNKGGFYKRHQDVFWINPSENHRKLSCVVQLSDPDSYEGGNLVFHDCDEYPNQDIFRKQGTVIFFPSFVFHEVQEVLKGNRYSLVCWIYGPKWR